MANKGKKLKEKVREGPNPFDTAQGRLFQKARGKG
jgi:hypothetical protein